MDHVRHHATLFVDPAVSEPIEAMRRRWDPEMARQIAAHTTLIYPWEADDPAMIAAWLREVAPHQPPFRCRVGDLRRFPPEHGPGCGFEVVDVDGGHSRLRSLVTAPGFAPGDVEPHVTVVHPRTSRLGDEAWAASGARPLELEFWVRDVAITAWDGDHWSTIEVIQLTG